MARPDDIPEDVWQAAERVSAENCGADACVCAASFARAIMAERQRCVTIVAEHHSDGNPLATILKAIRGGHQ